MKKLACLTLAVTAAAFAGCGGSSGGGPANPDDFIKQAGNDVCSFLVKCGVLAQSELPSCQAQANLTPEPYDPNGAEAMGRISYNAAAAQTCLNDIQSLTCQDFRKLQNDCDFGTIFTPKVNSGGQCTSDIECIGGYCSGMTSGCAGTCMAYLGTGASCTRNSQCGKVGVAYCDSNSKCALVGGVGASCMNASDCQPSLVCTGASAGTAGTCSNPLMSGAACQLSGSFEDPCADGLYCALSSFMGMAASGTCTAKGATGTQCKSFDGCNDGLVCKGFNVSFSIATGITINPGTCVAWLDEGASCSKASNPMTTPLEISGCPYDSVCSGSTPTCAVPGKTGAACGGTTGTAPAGCQTGYYCDASTNTCKMDVAWNQTCTPGTPDPCAQGTCDTTTHTCTVVCM